MTFSAKVICDSINNNNKRITTLQLKYPRFIHSQFLTHRVFSRNSSSSRAIPVSKLIEEVRNDPVFPIEWGANNPGMSSKSLMAEEDAKEAKELWYEAMEKSLEIATNLAGLGAHKQIVNRILEPYQHIHTIVTATDFDNFFKLRLDDEAQPEIQRLAIIMKEALDKSTPVKRDSHYPYLSEDDLKIIDPDNYALVSAARCARVSYLNHDGSKPDLERDLKLAKTLLEHFHMSPFEHQAVARVGKFDNFYGWKSYRNYITTGLK